jgi:hypothetical protein
MKSQFLRTAQRLLKKGINSRTNKPYTKEEIKALKALLKYGRHWSDADWRVDAVCRNFLTEELTKVGGIPVGGKIHDVFPPQHEVWKRVEKVWNAARAFEKAPPPPTDTRN